MPALLPEQIHQQLSARFGDAIGPLSAPAKDPFCTFKKEKAQEIFAFLKEEPSLAFDFLEDETATDHPKEGLIRVVYHFYSYTHRHMFVAKVELDRKAPEVATAEGVWKAANWMEREIFDLFGVSFTGHSDQRRLLLPPDWVGHPLRKDYSEAGGYRDISNVRDNPLDLFLAVDRQKRPAPPPSAHAAPSAAAPAAAPPAAPTPAPAGPKSEG